MISHWAARTDHRQSSAALRGVLVARVLWNLWFAVQVLGLGTASVAVFVDRFSRFALVDGLLAFTMALGYLLVSPRRLLWLSPAADAVTRFLLVLVARAGPGFADFPVTAIIYVGLIATFAFSDGLLDVVEGCSLRLEFGRGGGWLPLAMSGALAMTIGVAMFALDADAVLLRNLLALLSTAHALALASALRHVRDLLTAPIDRSAFGRRIATPASD